MSYILEALKKKDATNAGDIPDLSSQHHYLESEESQNNNLKYSWLILASLLLLALVVIAYLLGSGRSSNGNDLVETNNAASLDNSTAKFEPQETMAKPVLIVAAEPIELKPAVVQKRVLREPIVVQKRTMQDSTQTDSEKKSASKLESKSEIFIASNEQNIERNLADDVSALPALTYTTHVYADEAKDRFVMLNGSAYSIGDRLANGIKIEDILDNDLLVIYKGKYYKLPALSDVNR